MNFLKILTIEGNLIFNSTNNLDFFLFEKKTIIECQTETSFHFQKK